jgi:Lrp/AsnC family transcriptional regulator, regulator for asnA, asnC and gidA
LSKLDRLDKALISLLNRDARAPSAHIARELSIAERTVHNRIKRLIELGIIQPIAVVNPAAFGYTLAVDIFCELEVGYQEQAVKAILGMPEVSYLALSTGDQDISLQALFKNGDEMQAFITNKLHQVPGMRRTRAVLIPRILKDTYQWLPPANSNENSIGDASTDARR